MPRKNSDTQQAETGDGSPAVDFEKSLEALEALVEQLEGGDLPLEKALEAFETGVRLTRECQQALREAEQKVAILSGNGDDARAVPFEDDDD